MQIEAFPMQLVALTDGVLDGHEHVVLFLDHQARSQPCGYALSLTDARRLLEALTRILPDAQQIQKNIRDSN